MVERFLAMHPVSGWVGIGLGKSPVTLKEVVDDGEVQPKMPPDVFHEYGVRWLPQTVLIDPMGRIAAVTSANAVDQRVLENLLAARPISLPPPPLEIVRPVVPRR